MVFYSKDTHVDHDFKKRKEKKKNVEDNPAVKNLMLYRIFVCAQKSIRCSQFSIHRHCTFRFLQLDLLETRQRACRVIKVIPRFTSYELNMH